MQQHEVKAPLEAPSEAVRSPWEIWSYGQNVEGVSIKVSSIRAGDEFLKNGDYAAGLRAYQKVDVGSLNEKDREALVVRIASAEMGLGRYRNALETVSHYFEGLGLGAESVSGQFALILGYGYGANADYDQSLAWFGRADNTSSSSPLYSNAAQHGARHLIASIPENKFDEAYARWKDDVSVGGFFKRERVLRSDPEYRAAMIGVGSKFWKRELSPEQPLASDLFADTQKLEHAMIGVILPLSGQLSPLGLGTKNGMDLAMEIEAEPRIQVQFKDSQGDVTNATTVARDLIKVDKATVIIGPLLQEPANAVRLLALQYRVPELSLSKGNNFETGGMIFRFGATSNSQADTLLDACSNVLGMSKFAVIYPENAVGVEYASSFKKYISAKGLELAFEATYQPEDEAKLMTIAGELERLSVDGVFVPDSIANAQAFFGLLSESARDKIRPLGPATWDDSVQLANSQALLNRAVFVSPFFNGSSNPLVERFINLYTQKFGRKPDFLAAQGFDAMTLIIGAVRKMMESGIPFELAFKEIESYSGLTGEMRVDVSGEVHRSYVVIEAVDGVLRPLNQTTAQSIDNASTSTVR